MNREHLHVESRGRGDGSGDGVRDVVKFEVQKNGRARVAHAADDVRPGAGEKFAADFECADGRRDFMGELQSLFRRWQVERGDDRISHELNIKAPYQERKRKITARSF